MKTQLMDAPAQPADAAVDDVLSLAEIISALSFAIDLTEGAVPGHAVRCCVLGMRIGRELGLSRELMSALYYALLLKDAGCSNNAARMCQLVGGDDRRMKSGSKLVDWAHPHRSMFAGVRLLWREVLPGASVAARIKRILDIGRSEGNTTAEMISLRCERGAEIARKLGLAGETAEAIHALDEHWDGSGHPLKLKAAAIPLLARILSVAQHLDVFASDRSPAEAIEVLRRRSGSWFDPALITLVLKLEREGRLWTACLPTDDADAARQIVLGLQPEIDGIHADEIDRICLAFADVVDAKSPFTYRHSLGVAQVANEMAVELGLEPERCQLVRRAALLHDLGKLGVPNTILDKAGRLTEEEWTVVVEHPRLTREILMRIKPFKEIAHIAGAHHERLDGSGYPQRLTARDLCLEARLIAVADFYRALTEDRPYRKELPHEEAMAILRQQGGALDVQCIAALDRARGQAGNRRPDQPFRPGQETAILSAGGWSRKDPAAFRESLRVLGRVGLRARFIRQRA